MRTLLKSIIIASVLCLACNTASAQTLKDILGQVTNNSTVSDIVEQVTGIKLSSGDIRGTWNYSGSAVKLESEDLVKSATAGIAATQVEKKLDEYVWVSLEEIEKNYAIPTAFMPFYQYLKEK